MIALRLKNLLKQSIFYNLGGTTGRFLRIFLTPIYARIFSPAEYGVIDLIATVTVLLNFLLVLGVDGAVGRYFVDNDDEEDKKLTASTGLFFIFTISVSVILCSVQFSSYFSNLIFGTSEYSHILLVALSALPASVLLNYFLSMLKWSFKAGQHAAISIIGLITEAFLTISFVVFFKWGLIGIYAARLTSVCVFAVITFYFCRHMFKISFSVNRLKALLVFGLPYVPLYFSNFIISYSDRYFIKYFLGLTEVGIYGVGCMLASILSLALMGFQKAWTPFVYANYKKEDAVQIFSKIFSFCSVLICFITVLVSLFSKELMLVFSGRDYIQAYKVVPWIMLSLAAFFFASYLSIGIGIAKKTYHRAWGSFVTMIINLTLNFLLVPKYGIMGAAVATMISYLVLAFLMLKISQKLYPIDQKPLANLSIYIIAVGLIVLGQTMFPSLNLTTILQKFILLIVFVTIPFLLKLIELKNIGYLMNLFKNLITKKA